MIAIVTDSSSDLPADIVARHSIEIVPLTIRFGDREYVDRVELDTEGFWELLEGGESLPETAAPSAGAFLDAFGRLAEAGVDGVLAICISSDLSATYQAAVIAAERLADSSSMPVRILDSRSVSMGLGLQVVAAAEDAETETSLDALVTRALSRPAQTSMLAALDTIEFLRRGGRIGSASALIADLLDVKPLITIADGVVSGAGRVRTRSKARERIVAECLSRGTSGRLAVFGGRTPGFEETADRIEQGVEIPLIRSQLGAVVGTHAGPGLIGMAHLSA